MTTLAQISETQAQKATTANENFSDASRIRRLIWQTSRRRDAG
jgi:hypothetical protein